MRNLKAVWKPQNLPEDEQMLLALLVTPTQTMDGFLLEIEMRNKIVRMAEQEELTDREVKELLEMDPSLAHAIGPNDETKAMAQACLMADPIAQAMARADLSSKPVIDRQLQQALKDQTLADWMGIVGRMQS